MDFCPHPPNATIGNTNITWVQASANLLDIHLKKVSYLRPDTAGALLPWIYTIILIIIHVPVVFIRVVRWQAVQYWCLVSTFFTIVIYIQAYISTRFDASKVLVWTPLILVIDAGSMLQVFFLVVELKKKATVENSIEDRLFASSPFVRSEDVALQDRNEPPTGGERTKRPVDGEVNESNNAQTQGSPSQLAQSPLSKVHTAVVERPLMGEVQRDVVHSRRFLTSGFFSSGAIVTTTGKRFWYRDPTNFAMVCAALLFIIVLVLQLLALAKAIEATGASSEPPPVSWCSPLFQPFGLTAVDSSCNIYPISQSAHRGIGCITIPGHWQQQWLKGTIAGISIQLVTELIDLLILSLVNGRRKIFQAVKMKRPWATMFSGLIVLIVTLIYGIGYSQYLPPGVTDKIMVVIDIEGPASYMGTLTGGGLRGTIIGWNDGLFESWKAAYFGNWEP